MHDDTSRPQPPAPAPRPLTLELLPRPPTPETHTLSGPVFLGLVTPQKPRPAAPTLQEAEAAGNTSDVDVEQQRLGELADGDSLLDVPLPDVPLQDVLLLDVSLPDVPLPDVPIPDVPLPEAHPDCSVGKEWTSPRVAEEAFVRVRVGFLSCEFPLL